MKRIALMTAALAALVGCTPTQQTVATVGMEAAGVPGTGAAVISTSAGAAGQLLCQTAAGWEAVQGANVLNAAGKDVANVCAALGGTPGMPATATTATVVTVASDLITALNDGKKLASAQ